MKNKKRVSKIGSSGAVICFAIAAWLIPAGVFGEPIKPEELGTITVTAQKTEENIQDVPISMSVFDELDLEDKRIKSIKDIAAYTPNLMLFDIGGAGTFMPTIRGIATEEGSDSTSVGMYIDGIPVLGTSGFDLVLTDIERIEVLKGPQGTLYGRGTEAGVINIITKKPGNEIRGKLGLELGSDNKREYFLGVSAPILKDKLYIGISARHYEKDGLIKNTYLGGYTDDREHNYGKINLRYTPTDNLDISLISSFLKHDDGGNNFNPMNQPRENSSNEQYVKPETLLHALKIAYDYDDYKFESITTYKKITTIWKRDYDYTPSVGMHSVLGDGTYGETITQEFRLSRNQGNLKWLVGVNADRKEENSDYKLIQGSKIDRDKGSADGNSFGAFAHANYALNEYFSLIAGLRYDKIDQGVEESNINIDSSEEEISPKFGFEYKLNKDSMLYTTISKGYRPGGFYTFAPEGYSKIFKKETLWSYEVGSKNSFLDNRLVINGALYYMAVDDMQVTTVPDGIISYKSNAAKAISKGFELDVNYQATNSLSFFASFGYNDTKFDDYKDSSGDYSGNYNPFAPKYNYNIGAQYRVEQGYYARVDINGYGDMYFDKENKYKKDAYDLVNAKVGYEAEKFDVYLYLDNLFDKEYDSNGMYGYYTIYSPPREMGIQLTYRF